jgi:hypothetical protein
MELVMETGHKYYLRGMLSRRLNLIHRDYVSYFPFSSSNYLLFYIGVYTVEYRLCFHIFGTYILCIDAHILCALRYLIGRTYLIHPPLSGWNLYLASLIYTATHHLWTRYTKWRACMIHVGSCYIIFLIQGRDRMWLLTCCLEEILIKALARCQLVIHWLAVGTVGCNNGLPSVQVSVLVFPVTSGQNRVVYCEWLKIIFPQKWNTEVTVNRSPDSQNNLF